MEFVAGAGRILYEWPDRVVNSVLEKMKPQYFPIQTEAGPALGLLYPRVFALDQSIHIIGVISFSQLRTEILSRARIFLLFSSLGLLLVILFVLYLSFDCSWAPSDLITRIIDAFQHGAMKNGSASPGGTNLDDW